MLGPDDPVEELLISSTMTKQINELKQAVRNANAASSMIQLAESASKRIATDLTKMRGLAVHSADSTLNTEQRAELDEEFQELITSIGEVTEQTLWRGKKLLDGKSYPHGIKFQLDGLADNGIELFFGDLTHNSVTSLFGTALTTLNINGAVANTDWQQRSSELPVLDPEEHFSLGALNSDATTLAAFVTRPSATENQTRVRIFDWLDGEWQQRGGEIYTDETIQSASKYSVIDASLNSDGNSICIAELRFERSGLNSWWVGVFDWDGTLWTQRGEALDDSETGIDISGIKLSSDGDSLIVGSRPQDYSLEDPDQSKVFDWNGTFWVQRGNELPGASRGQQTLTIMNDFGDTISMLVTAPQIAIYVLAWDGNNWAQQGSEIPIDLSGEFGCVTAISSDGNTLAYRTLGVNNQREKFDEIVLFRWNGSDWRQLGGHINIGNTGSTSDAMSLSSDGGSICYSVLAENQSTLRIYVSDWTGSTWETRRAELSIDLTGELSETATLLSVFGTSVAIPITGDAEDPNGHIVICDYALETSKVIAALDSAINVITNHTVQHGIAIEKLDAVSQELTDTVITAESANNRIDNTSDASKTTELTRSQITEQAVVARMTQANQQAEQVMELLKQL